MITTTCNDWYYDRTSEWNYSDFMDIITLRPIEIEFGQFLGEEETNVAKPSVIPFLDLGEKPSSFGPNRVESE